MDDKKRLIAGNPAPEARVYKCSGCGALAAMLQNENAPRCETCNNAGKTPYWIPTSQRLITASKDVAKEFEKRSKWHHKLSDIITAIFGSMTFVVIHIIWFTFWILANMGKIPGVPVFDPFPFGLLTMVVSLEAIILATFILVSQNRAGERAELRSEFDYQVDLKAEKHLAEILELLREKKNNKKKK